MASQNDNSRHKLDSFLGKKFLITGAARGLGKALVKELCSRGAIVHALSKNPDNLKVLKEEYPSILTICVDLADWNETRVALKNLEPIDCLINNAGIVFSGSFWETTQEEFDSIYKVNLRAVLNVSQIVAKKMIENGTGGTIVNVSSSTGKIPYPNILAYSTLKAALEMMTKIMAVELGPHKILVNSVCPAVMPTDMYQIVRDKATENGINISEVEASIQDKTPTRTFYMPVEEVVEVIMFFASGKLSQVTGESLLVDGGFSITL